MIWLLSVTLYSFFNSPPLLTWLSTHQPSCCAFNCSKTFAILFHVLRTLFPQILTQPILLFHSSFCSNVIFMKPSFSTLHIKWHYILFSTPVILLYFSLQHLPRKRKHFMLISSLPLPEWKLKSKNFKFLMSYFQHKKKACHKVGIHLIFVLQ